MPLNLSSDSLVPQMSSILRSSSPYLKCSPGQRCTLRRHRRRYAQSRQTPSYQSCRKVQEWLYPRLTIRISPQCYIARLCYQRCLHGCIVFLGIKAHTPQRLESIVRQDVDPAVVRLQVIDLFPEEQGPEVFAEELDHVEGRCWSWGVAGETRLRSH
jgi:hypothetical protein